MGHDGLHGQPDHPDAEHGRAGGWRGEVHQRVRHDEHLRDHAAVFCELDDGGAALCEGQRMLPDTKGSDYRVTVAGSAGYADLGMADNCLVVTDPEGADQHIGQLPEPVSVVADWLGGGDVVPQEASLRANRLAVLATMAAHRNERIEL